MLRRLWKRLRNSNHGAKENRKTRHRPLRAGLEPLERRELLAILIDSFADLQAMNQNLSAAYELTADVDCTGNTLTPVGTSSAPFTGSLDGKGYKITALRTSSLGSGGDPYVGLFGCTSGATLTDVVLENVDIDASGGSDWGYLYVGGLAGKATNTRIDQCEVSGDVDANSYGGVYAGGLVGYVSDTTDKDMTASVATCTVDGRTDTDNDGYAGYGGYVGGLVGRADGLDIDQCSATGNATAYSSSGYGGQYQFAGGLVGYCYLYVNSGSDSITINSSYATGIASATSSYAGTFPMAYAGGLIGYNFISAGTGSGSATETIQQSHATGTADANAGGYGGYYGYGGIAYSGGLIGYDYVSNSGSGTLTRTITSCYATGTADTDAVTYSGSYLSGTPTAYAGGLIGYGAVGNTGSGSATTNTQQSYAAGLADAYAYAGTSYGSGYGMAYSGGLVGYNYVASCAGGASATQQESYATGNAHATSNPYSYYMAYGGSAYAGGLIGYDYVLNYGTGTTSMTADRCYATGTAEADANAYGSSYGAPYAFAGGLVGYSYLGSNSTGTATLTVDESHATGTADADAYATAAYSSGCSAYAYAGGLVAYNTVVIYGGGTATANFTVSYGSGMADADAMGYGGSYGYGGPSPAAYAGGLIGYNSDTSSSSGTAATNVDQCYAAGTSDAYASIPSYTYGGAYAYSGGLVGYNTVSSSSTGTANSTVDESYATGTVNGYAYGGYYYGGYGGYYYGSAYSGGLMGYEYLYKGASATASATISNAYATGNATARGPYDAVAGGLIGLVTASGTTAAVTNCYSIGVPDAQYDSTPLEGGLVGYSSNVTYTSCYWDTTTSGKTDGVDNVDPDPSGVSGKTTAEMMTQSTFVGWDFDCDGQGACHNGVWIMAGYPHLQMEQKFKFKVGGSIHITNLADLQAMNETLNEDYYIDVDINASETADWNGGQGFVPIGTKDFPFTGTLDGQWHIISNFTINRPDGDEQGLIGYLDTRVGGTGGTVSRVRMENVSVTVYAPYVYPQYPFSDNTGGIAGKSEGTISDCYVTGTLDGNDDLGGIVGESQGGTVQRCYANITVPYHADSDNIGGLVGDNDGGTIRQSYSAGTIACAAWVGGLVGQSRGVIEDCYSTATVQGGTYAGGLVGKHYVSSGTSAVRRSYSTGTVTGTRYVGGFAGYVGSGAVVEDCFEIGNATGNYAYGPDVGTFMGGGYTANMTNNYYTGTATNTGGGGTNTSGATSTTVQALTNQDHAVYTRVADPWDFDANGAGPGANGEWIMAYLPHLQIEHNFIPVVSGRKSISNVTQLQLMAVDLDGAYSLAGNISASDTANWNYNGTACEGFLPIGRDTSNTITTFQANDYEGTVFSGSLDGANYKITSLYINRPDEDYVSLFGNVQDSDIDSSNWQDRAPLIQRLTIENPKIIGRRYVAGLVGLNDAKIQNCIVTATTYGQGSTDGYVRAGGDVNDGGTHYYVGFDAGGLAGKSTEECLSVIENCTARILVDYNTVGGHACNLLNVGGLVGHANDIADNWNVATKIINSTAEGDVVALTDFAVYTIFTEPTNFNNHVGGLVGEHDGLIQGTVVGSQQYCTATGAVYGARNVGGLIGELDGMVEFARATGTKTVQGRRSVGGLIGMIENTAAGQAGDARDCSATRPVTGLGTNDVQLEHIGGFVGQNEGGLILRCSASGNVDAPDQTNVGGFAGSHQVSTTGTPRDHDTVGGTPGDLIAGEGYISASYATGTVNGRSAVGGFVGHNTNATIDHCYATGATTMVEDQDITVTAATGNVAYRVGGFVGYNETAATGGTSEAHISECYATGSVVGRFGAAGTPIDIHFTTTANLNLYVGGFVGQNNDNEETGTRGAYIHDCYSRTGTVTVLLYAHEIIGDTGYSPEFNLRYGGFAGRNHGHNGTPTAQIEECYSANGTVSASVNYTTLTNVMFRNQGGGFIGRNNDGGSVIDCFWDTQTTGQSTSHAGTGRTTHEMQDPTGHPFPGTWLGTVWHFQNGQYPHLHWQ